MSQDTPAGSSSSTRLSRAAAQTREASSHSDADSVAAAYAEAQDDYVGLHTSGKVGLKQQTLAELQASLDPSRFVRIHRSYLLNLDRLARLESEGEARAAVLGDGTRLPVSRAGYARLKALL